MQGLKISTTSADPSNPDVFSIIKDSLVKVFITIFKPLNRRLPDHNLNGMTLNVQPLRLKRD